MRRPLASSTARRRGERGQASLEMVALSTMLLAVVVLLLQLVVYVYTAHGAAQAAREGARAYSLGQSYQEAALAAVPGGVTLVEAVAVGPDHSVRVVVQAPTGFVLGKGLVTSTVTMP
ncbi:MAG: TadE/TadG family type IV pilus assembly protein [Janthinobacterium lividum]